MDVRSPLYMAMVQQLERRGCLVQSYFRFGNWYLDVAGKSFEEYRDSLPSLLKNTIQRKGRKLDRTGDGRHVIATLPEQVDAAFADYEAVYANSWKETEPNTAFIREIVRRFAERGWLRLGVLYVKDVPVAAQIWFVHGKIASIFKLAYDQRYKSLSGGTLLTAELMRHVIDHDGVECVDYLCGDEAYKKDWMSDRKERWGIRAYKMPGSRFRRRAARGSTAVDEPDRTAVVVGLCSHGLSVVRGLASNGVKVYALERNGKLPGTKTRCAEVVFTDDINNAGLTQGLLNLRQVIDGRQKPVLYLTNDNMVARVAKDWDRLASAYELPWGHCRETVSAMLVKSNLEKRCNEVGLNYPRSWLLKSPVEVERYSKELIFPVIIKPVRPLSLFKVVRLGNIDELRALVAKYKSEYPFLVQQWIPGDDRRLFFCALYLERGKVLGRFDGRKLLSHPPALGQTTVAEPCLDDEVYQHTRRFFDGLELSGPVSLELKRDDDGGLWVIEPTVGRTDFWLSVCVANGVNLPHLQHLHVSGQPMNGFDQSGSIRWFDTERDPGSFFRIGRRGTMGWRPAVFPYCSVRDPLPFVWALSRFLRDAPRKITRQHWFSRQG